MEKISVSVRVRPLSKQEQAKGSAWNISSNTISLCNSVGLSVSGQSYTFDRVFGTDSKTSDIYEARTKDIIASAVGGFNGTVFAYGQTSSGKTYTMRGSPTEPGITPLAVQDVFNNIEKEDDREFLLRVSYMEIYNEEINDLLSPENCKLQVHENLERGIFVAGLREEIVVSPEQVLQLMDYGEAHRHIGETNMNVYSSRSHTIFRMVIESRDKSHDGPSGHAGIQACDAVRVSVLNLVDLAGSERAAKTGAEGARLKEGSHINKSLMTLGTVINKLSEGIENLGGHVPYRDSKLTRILQPALGGNAKTAIICNITPAWVHVDETKGTLQFASRAIRVTNCAQVNEVLTDAALLKRQKKEIEELRSRLQESQSEHLEEEILNLRNAMLKAELEREHLTKQIVNLSTMVLNSAVDDRGYDKRAKKNNRRETWCPQLLPAEPMEIQSAKKAFVKGMFEPLVSGKRDRKLPLPPPFEKLSEEDEAMDHSIWSPDRSIDKKLGEGKLSPDQSTNFLEANACMYVAERRKRSSMDRMVSNEEELLELQAKFQNLCWEHETAISEIKRLSSETEHLRRELSWHEKNSHHVKLANNLEGYQRCKSMGDCEIEASLLMEALQVQGSKKPKSFDESKKEEIQFQREMEMCDKVLIAAFCDLKDEIGNLQVYALDSLQMLMHDFRCLQLEISAKLTNKQDAEVPSQRRLKRKFDIICDGISPTTLDQSEIKIEIEKNGLGDAVETAQYKLSSIDEGLGPKGQHFEQELQILADKLKCALEEKSLYEQERDVFAGKLAITEARNVTLEEEIDMLCRKMDNERYQAESTQKDSDISVMEERSVTENVHLLSEKHEILSNDVGKLRCESSRTIHCMEDLEIKLAEEKAARMRLLLELESNTQQLAEKVELLAKQDTDFAHLVSINMELENTKELLEAKLQVQEAEIRRLEKEVNTVQAELERCCDQHQIETSQHRSEIAALRKEILSAKAGPSLIEKERDNMKKELDRLKLKTKDVEAKLKSTLQDKSKLEAERANMERELKALRGQSNLLQRDLNRRESMADKRRETIASGISKTKHQYSSIENAFQVKSTELEKANFELQVFQDSFAKIEASLTQAQETSKLLEKRLAAAEEEIVALKDEKSKLILENEGLRTEVEEKLHSAESELASARQYIESLVLDVEANLAKSEAARLEVDALARQKEELLLELTNAHYQFEEERATMSAKVASAKDLSDKKDIYISSLTQRISSLNSHLEKVSGLEMEIVSTNEKCKKYEEEIMNVRQNMDEEHRMRCEIMCILQKKEVDLSIATKELENMLIASTKLRFAFDAMAARAEVFEGRLEDARWELIEFKEKVSRTHPHESAWASKLNNLEKKLAASRLQVVEMKIELESSRAECNKQKQILLNYQRAGGQAMEEHYEIKRLGDLVEEKDSSDLQLAVQNLHYQKRKLEDEVTAFKCMLSSTKKCAEDHQQESTPKRKSFDLLFQEPVSSLKKKLKDMEQKEKKEHIAAEQSQPGYPRRVALSPIKLNTTGLSIPDQNSPLKKPIKGKSNTLFTCNDTFPGFGVADPLKVHAISYGKENST